MSALVTVRFPSGATEYRMSEAAPEVGEILTGHGNNWIVDDVSSTADGSTVVTLRADVASQPGPEDAWPGPLDEVPPFFAY